MMIREKVSRSRDTGEGAAGTAKAQREKKALTEHTEITEFLRITNN